MYPPLDIDKVHDRGETWPVDPELRDTLNQLAVDLRVESRAGDAETCDYIDERVGTSAAETRRHVEVVGGSLRSDIRGVAEGMALLSQRMGWRDDEQAGRTGCLEGRVLKLGVRVTSLEDDRKPHRPRSER
jgi:hypothetical protein